jgi:hypothetical protein
MTDSIELGIRRIAHTTELLLGSMGEATAPVQPEGQPAGEIRISRGGLIVPHQTYDEYYRAIRREDVYDGQRGPFKAGELIYPDAPFPEEVLFDPSIIHIAHTISKKIDGQPNVSNDFLIHQDQSAGTWIAHSFNGTGMLRDHYQHMTTYFLGDAKPIETDETVMALEGLLAAFVNGVRARQSLALKLANEPIRRLRLPTGAIVA